MTITDVTNTADSGIAELIQSTDLHHHAVVHQHEKEEEAATAAAKTDEVKLSGAAAARSLQQSGESVVQIAAELGTTTKAVDEYLGITASQEASLLTSSVR